MSEIFECLAVGLFSFITKNYKANLKRFKQESFLSSYRSVSYETEPEKPLLSKLE